MVREANDGYPVYGYHEHVDVGNGTDRCRAVPKLAKL